MSIHALILAGGQGSRLGQIRKADLRLGGATLFERVAGQLRDVGTPLLISVGADAPATTWPGIALPDLDLPIGGPLAGLISAAAHLERAAPEDVLVTVAVDTPFLPNDYVRRLVAALGAGAPAAQAGWGGNFYPTNAIWRLSALADLPAMAREGTLPKSAKALLAMAGATDVDWSDTHQQDPFANLNTMADLVALARRLDAQGL
jgi:molybdopterin-guanine dinucleotide biosynthesis protein A